MWIFCVKTWNLFFSSFLSESFSDLFPHCSGIACHVFSVGLFFSILCVLSGPFGIFLKYFFYFFFPPPPPRNSYPILDLLDWFYNFLFSLFHLFIFFSLLWISSTLFSNPCVFHFCYILDFQSSFFFFWMLPLLKVFYYCFMDFFLFLKILMIVFEIVTFAKVLYPSSCFSPCSFVLYALL